MIEESIRILLVDDDEDDVYLTRELLFQVEGVRYELDWVDNFEEALRALGPDLYGACLIDYRLGPESGIELIRAALGSGCETPMILLTGQGHRDVDLEAMKAGACDYLVKGQINPAMIERAIRYAMERKRAEREREDLLRRLQAALAEVKTLSGLLRVCSSCKNIRDDEGHWTQMETYIKNHSQADFTHGLCPICFEALYPDYSPG